MTADQKPLVLPLPEIESRVCDIAAEQLGLDRSKVHPALRLIQDLHCDSLALVELFMNVEEAFDVTLPNDPPNTAYKAVFTRDPFRLSDLAEMVYLQRGSGRILRPGRWGKVRPLPARRVVPFTQLGGRAPSELCKDVSLFEPLGKNEQGHIIHRRRTDGMVCVLVRAGEAVLGTNADDALTDERPAHSVKLDGFLMDQETVSTTAYCRFLNSVGPVAPTVLLEWFLLTPDDKRRDHMLLRHDDGNGWIPLPGTEQMPMMLVSWYGANAYSLWANHRDWRAYHGDEGRGGQTFLPSEAQWEYAARGPESRRFPWGDDEPTPDRMRYAQHSPGHTYRPETLPMAEVNSELGMSPFGLRHMAGNVWQWCRDWYWPRFYTTTEGVAANPVCRQSSRVRSERGGSWVGPGFLCRSSYRRGRVPIAKGRCLGFRCVGIPSDMGKVAG